MHDDPMTNGERLRAIRKNQHKRQDDVAAALGISAAAVSKWESDKSPPTREHAHALDEYLQTDGEIATMYGYADESAQSRLNLLAAQVDRLLALVEAQQRQIDELQGASAPKRSSRAAR